MARFKLTLHVKFSPFLNSTIIVVETRKSIRYRLREKQLTSQIEVSISKPTCSLFVTTRIIGLVVTIVQPEMTEILFRLKHMGSMYIKTVFSRTAALFSFKAFFAWLWPRKISRLFISTARVQHKKLLRQSVARSPLPRSVFFSYTLSVSHRLEVLNVFRLFHFFLQSKFSRQEVWSTGINVTNKFCG